MRNCYRCPKFWPPKRKGLKPILPMNLDSGSPPGMTDDLSSLAFARDDGPCPSLCALAPLRESILCPGIQLKQFATRPPTGSSEPVTRRRQPQSRLRKRRLNSIP